MQAKVFGGIHIMADEKTVYGAKSIKLAQLLKQGAQAKKQEDHPPRQQHQADLLRDYLAGKLPPADSGSNAPGSRDPFPNSLQSAISDSVGQYLDDRTIPLDILRDIKAYGAGLSRNAESEIEREPAHVIYYAAIAAALVHHGQKITEFTCNSLHQSYSLLAEMPWITTSLRKLFQQAATACEELPSRRGEP